MPTTRVLAALATSTLLTVTSGCAAFSDDAAGATEAGGDLRVVASFYPLQYVAQQVAGERADVASLTQPGGEPHDLELAPRQTAEIAEADLLVYESGFQPAVDDSVEQNATGETLDATEVVDLRPLEDDHAEDEHTEDEHTGEEHAHEDEHAEEEHADEGHAEDDHDHGDVDPHFWQDPARMADLGDAVAERLADVDPDHADEYAANAADLRAELEELDAAYAETLASCERDTVVVSHDAFGYLDKYGLELEAINGLSPGAEPTPSDLARLQDLIEDEGITTVFSERLVSARLAESLASDAGVETAVLDPIEGLSDETADEDYVSLMRANLEALAQANGCR
ncbi:metal ABC transporter substrate-binding protein [Nocardioides aequoreus]|uniref:metal ABC transporter substrate-binding protein n=1 Tax=Nocardioides aequoreus TaxID=397278 RepID=UPI0004C31294|nr:metal ABC transporter substrate-binding protein [Nocardioides aequoreus]